MITPLTPLDFKRRAVKLYHNKLAVIDGEKRFTYVEFAERCDRLSRGLKDLGVKKDVKVAVLAPNTHEMLECFYGICQLGAVLVPLNIRLKEEELRYIIDHSDAEVIVVDSEWGATIDTILPQLPKVRHVVQIDSGYESPLKGIDYEQLLAQSSADPIFVAIDENDPITINYTSGTTSNPKGVVLTHRNTYINAADFLFHLHISVDDVYLHTLPMFHVNGWGGVWAVSGVGATHVCLRKIVPKDVLALMEKEKVTLACGAPTVLSMLLQAPNIDNIELEAHPRIATAGSPPPAAVIEKVQQRLNMTIIHVYGLTEAAPFISYCEWRDSFANLPMDEKAAMMSRQGVEMIFSGETTVLRDDGTEVAWDGKEIGEIVARGNTVMKEYYKQPEETAKAIRNGWFHTGDLAVIHPDGYIEIVDRSKDVIISGGENISSIEVEGVLFKHPDVLDVGVVSKPDEKWGEAPVAFIVLKEGSKATADELKQFCRSHLAHYKAPKEYIFVDQLPRTATGKIQKYRLRTAWWKDHEKLVH